MKITISPSEDQGAEVFPYYSITVEYPFDDQCTAERLVCMFYQCLQGTGMRPDVAQKALNEFTP